MYSKSYFPPMVVLYITNRDRVQTAGFMCRKCTKSAGVIEFETGVLHQAGGKIKLDEAHEVDGNGIGMRPALVQSKERHRDAAQDLAKS
jgi:hypothetical protein